MGSGHARETKKWAHKVEFHKGMGIDPILVRFLWFFVGKLRKSIEALPRLQLPHTIQTLLYYYLSARVLGCLAPSSRSFFSSEAGGKKNFYYFFNFFFLHTYRLVVTFFLLDVDVLRISCPNNFLFHSSPGGVMYVVLYVVLQSPLVPIRGKCTHTKKKRENLF